MELDNREVNDLVSLLHSKVYGEDFILGFNIYIVQPESDRITIYEKLVNLWMIDYGVDIRHFVERDDWESRIKKKFL